MATFTEVIDTYRSGKLAAEANDQLSELVQACHDVGAPGTFTLTIEVKPDKHGGSATELAAKIVTKRPRREIPKAIFYADGQGNLDRTDPETMNLFGDAADRRRAPEARA